VPGGTYTIGRDDGPAYARPAHPVTLDSFAIERTEVTVGDYREFVEATPTPAPWETLPDSMLPVTGVTWAEAQAYCAWRYEGGRLPTEQEWEAAARGLSGQRYPWGDTWAEGAANTASRGEGRPVPVGSHPEGANALGVQDLIGNVWEWTASPMEPYPGGSGPAGGERFYVSRGGAYNSRNDIADATFRGYLRPADSRANLRWTGFRCAMRLGE
jgi:iron(II)-dependent oxidoreductase